MTTPAARISDMHVCPMMTPMIPPIPHVGGPIVAGGMLFATSGSAQRNGLPGNVLLAFAVTR